MPRHFLSTRDCRRAFLEQVLFPLADEFLAMVDDLHRHSDLLTFCRGCTLFSMFHEPSTRTRFFLEQAAGLLGMRVVSSDHAGVFSSFAKGERVTHAIRALIGARPSVIALRHPERGSAAAAAAVSGTVPIINAGDGNGEHPTQTLLDLYSIKQELGRIDGITIVIGGDLANGRTVRSLAFLLAEYDNITILFLSPPELKMRDDVLDHLRNRGVKFETVESMAEAFPRADAVYWTRSQTERFANMLREDGTPVGDIERAVLELCRSIAGKYVIRVEDMCLLRPAARLFHPLPIVDEIEEAVLEDPRSAVFRQAANGLPTKMALLKWMLEES